MVIASKNTCVGKYNVYMAGFGLGQLDKYVKKLLNHGYTDLICSRYTRKKHVV